MVVEPVESLEVTPPPEDLGPALQQVGVLLRPKDPAVRDVGEAGLCPPLKVLCDLGGWKTAQAVLQSYRKPDEDRLRKALEAYREVGSASN